MNYVIDPESELVNISKELYNKNDFRRWPKGRDPELSAVRIGGGRIK